LSAVGSEQDGARSSAFSGWGRRERHGKEKGDEYKAEGVVASQRSKKCKQKSRQKKNWYFINTSGPTNGKRGISGKGGEEVKSYDDREPLNRWLTTAKTPKKGVVIFCRAISK